MSESHEQDAARPDEQDANSNLLGPTPETEMLEMHIARALQQRAAPLHFTPAMRVEVMQRIAERNSRLSFPRRILVTALSIGTALVLLLATIASLGLLHPTTPPVQVASLSFVTQSVLNTPQELARGGLPISLDPTGRYLVYGIANQPGVLYVTDLRDPVERNELAMRFARDVAWSPDGSALVTTIYPVDSTVPLLALVPTGQYMRLLGEPALAAAWLPSSANTITYITENNGQVTLWQVMPDGKNAHPVGSMAMPALVQRLSWSPDGRFLAILATPGSNPDRGLLQGPNHALYLFDTQAKALVTLAAPGSDTIGNIAWSPDGRLLTYEQIDNQQHVSLHTIEVSMHKQVFSIALQHAFLGMNWSPDSRALVYSDGGSLHARVLHGPPLDFSHVSGVAAYPFWLDEQHVLCLSIHNGIGQLTRLVEKAIK
ncbi:MAG TPA: hypothetical protein VFA41_10335 [Ktedonobacteraceae bacterium]|jgi:WD40 repeat protein|nr:hypothetical protein [Ktedonobacteraceae bacterium]